MYVCVCVWATSSSSLPVIICPASWSLLRIVLISCCATGSSHGIPYLQHFEEPSLRPRHALRNPPWEFLLKEQLESYGGSEPGAAVFVVAYRLLTTQTLLCFCSRQVVHISSPLFAKFNCVIETEGFNIWQGREDWGEKYCSLNDNTASGSGLSCHVCKRKGYRGNIYFNIYLRFSSVLF